MISGIYFHDEGQICTESKTTSTKDAFPHGIGMIHQHFKLVDVLTAIENIVLGLHEKGRLNMAAVSQKVKEICDAYGFDVDPNQKIYDMSVSQKQAVEIVKVLYRGADSLILDEPTAVLTPRRRKSSSRCCDLRCFFHQWTFKTTMKVLLALSSRVPTRTNTLFCHWYGHVRPFRVTRRICHLSFLHRKTSIDF